MKREPDDILLTRQELEIMKVVWELGRATVKEVCTAISRRKTTAYTTVLTLMSILEDKGVLMHDRCGRAYRYSPLLSRDQATCNQIRDLVERFFDGRADKLLEAVIEHEAVSPERLGELLDSVRAREEPLTV